MGDETTTEFFAEQYSGLPDLAIILQTAIDQAICHPKLGLSGVLYIVSEALHQRVEARKKLRGVMLREISQVMPFTRADADAMASLYDAADNADAEEIECLALCIAERPPTSGDGLQAMVDNIEARK